MFYQQARKRLIEADLVIMNHTLFFTCLGGLDEETTAEEGYLFPNDFVIFDEAHNLELTAARHVGLSVSSGALRYQLQKLFHPSTHKGLLALIRDAGAQLKVLDVYEAADEFLPRWRRLVSFGRVGSIGCGSRS
ncbi:MAG: hypothetical protein HC904_17650 [Blastochloris sp.]|nr:hypothetical protein [Blastochloris sp.]